MLDAARSAIRHAAGRSREDLDRDELLMLALWKLVELVGESARTVSQETRARAPEIPWAKIVGARHKLVHEYYLVDRGLLWRTVSVSLPELVASLEKMLEPPRAPAQPPPPGAG